MTTHRQQTARGGETRRAVGAALIALVPVALGSWAALAWADRVPDSLPLHWNIRGEVDDTAAFTPYRNILLGLALGAWAAGTALGAAPGVAFRVRRAVVAGTVATTTFLSGIWVSTLAVSLDRAAPTEAPLPGWQLALTLAAAGLLTTGAYLTCGRPPPLPAAARPSESLPRVPLDATERAAWSERRVVPVVFGIAGAVFAAGLVMALVLDPWLGAVLVVTALLTLWLGWYTLLVDGRGLRLGLGPVGWPRIVIRLEEIEAAHAIVARPKDWGGWGYRIMPRGQALMIRKGPALQLDLAGGRVFVATVGNPETAAGVINTYLDRTFSKRPNLRDDTP